MKALYGSLASYALAGRCHERCVGRERCASGAQQCGGGVAVAASAASVGGAGPHGTAVGALRARLLARATSAPPLPHRAGT